MTTTRRLRVAAVLAVLAMVAVGACQEPQEPETSTGAEPSSEVTTEVTTEPVTEPSTELPEYPAPERPAAIEQNDVTGAAAAAWYLLKTWDYMQFTGDTGPFESVASDSCNWCATAVSTVSELYESGGTATGTGFTFDIASGTAEIPTENDPAFKIRFDATVGPVLITEADGTQSDPLNLQFSPFVVAVEFVDDSFMVTGVNYDQL